MPHHRIFWIIYWGVWIHMPFIAALNKCDSETKIISNPLLFWPLSSNQKKSDAFWRGSLLWTNYQYQSRGELTCKIFFQTTQQLIRRSYAYSLPVGTSAKYRMFRIFRSHIKKYHNAMGSSVNWGSLILITTIF